MIIASYILGFLIYVAAVTMMYVGSIKSQPWYIPLNMTIGLIASFLWAWVVKHSPDKGDLYVKALVWDVMLIGVYSILPLLFGVKLTGNIAIGATLIVAGLIVMKL